jgi:SAM-dependent methyltransferase
VARVEELLAEAADRPLVGWDFSWLGDRLRTDPPAWDFAALIADRARRSPNLVDLDTGGGEWLSTLPARAPVTLATESYAPNVPVAAAQLRPLGVPVVQYEAAPDNVDQVPGGRTGRLPFRSGSLHLVCDRHASFHAGELARVLAPGGLFCTQQVGAGFGDGARRLLGLPVPAGARPAWSLRFAAAQLRAAGLTVLRGAAGHARLTFADVGALSWYLRMNPWLVEELPVRAGWELLLDLHERGVELTIRQPLFWLEAINEPS